MVSPRRVAVYAGTFDPIHYGHIGIIKRGITVFDHVVIAVAGDTGKNSLFDLETRVELVKQYFDKPFYEDKVTILPFHGLLVEFAKKQGAVAILRGLRAISDFDYEFQMALMNKKLESEIQTIFFMSDFRWMYVSSTNLKTVARLGGDIRSFVPKHVAEAVAKAYGYEYKEKHAE